MHCYNLGHLHTPETSRLRQWGTGGSCFYIHVNNLICAASLSRGEAAVLYTGLCLIYSSETWIKRKKYTIGRVLHQEKTCDRDSEVWGNERVHKLETGFISDLQVPDVKRLLVDVDGVSTCSQAAHSGQVATVASHSLNDENTPLSATGWLLDAVTCLIHTHRAYCHLTSKIIDFTTENIQRLKVELKRSVSSSIKQTEMNHMRKIKLLIINWLYFSKCRGLLLFHMIVNWLGAFWSKETIQHHVCSFMSR